MDWTASFMSEYAIFISNKACNLHFTEILTWNIIQPIANTKVARDILKSDKFSFFTANKSKKQNPIFRTIFLD